MLTLNEPLFEELKQYVGFNDQDARLIQELRPLVIKHIDVICDRFYRKIQEHTRVIHIFKDDEQVVRLKQTLRIWLEELFEGPYDVGYFKKRSKIGRKHVEIGLAHFYVIGAMHNLRNHFHEIVLNAFERRPKKLRSFLEAINKILDMELAVMVESYHEDFLNRIKAEEERSHRENLESLQTMVSSLAHEIRNPLNSANLHVTLLERRLTKIGVAEEAGKQIGVIRDEINRLEQLISDFIAFARPPRLNPIKANLNELIELMISEFTERAAAQKVNFRTSLDPSFTSFLFDWDRMQQVFSNLLINAIDALSEGGTIRIESEFNSGNAVIRVADNGPGLPEDKNIFEPFVTTKSQGTGLGLSVVRDIVEMHGGRISAENTESGACFTIDLSNREE